MRIIKLFIILSITVISIALSFLLQEITILLIGLLIDLILVVVLFKNRIFNFQLSSNRLSRPKIDKQNFTFKVKPRRPKKPKLRINRRILISQYAAIFLISLSIFTLYALFFYKSIPNNNFIIEYFIASVNSILSNPVLIFPLLILLFVFWLATFIKRRKLNLKYLLKRSIVILVAYVTAAFIIFLIASINIVAIAVSTQGQLTSGYISDPKELNNYLLSADIVPEVIAYDESLQKNLLLSSVSGFNGDSDFYENSVLTRLPNRFYKLIKSPNVPIFILNDLLVVKEIDQKEIEELSPNLGLLIVKKGIPNKNIKANAKVAVLNRQEYLKFREDQINEQIDELQEIVDEANSNVSYYGGQISKARSEIAAFENAISQASTDRVNDINKCKSAGYTSIYTGSFYRYHSDDYCNNRNTLWDQYVAGLQQNLAGWRSTLSSAQYNYSIAKEISDYYSGTVDLVESSKNQTPHELGLFLPENNHIKLALDTTQSDYLKDYVATLIHEYLHYTSYVSDERVLEHSLEEGLTEFFAKKIMEEQIGEYNQVGYPHIVKIIEGMNNKIPTEELLDIYFNKDQERFVYLLNEAYGDNFYEDSEFYFQIINLLPRDKAIKTANNILIRMGEDQISESEIN